MEGIKTESFIVYKTTTLKKYITFIFSLLGELYLVFLRLYVPKYSTDVTYMDIFIHNLDANKGCSSIE